MIRTFKVGGMRFIQVGQFSMSWCFTRKRQPIMSAHTASCLLTIDYGLYLQIIT